MAEKSKSNGNRGEKDPHGGSSEFNNFQRLLGQVLAVPKEKLDEQRAKQGREKERGKRAS